jgi:hypothetical protein
VNAATRDRIEQEANPIGFLIHIVRGEALDKETPTLEQRMNTARLLAGKVLPDLRGIEMQLDDQREKPVSEMTDVEIQALLLSTQSSGGGLTRCHDPRPLRRHAREGLIDFTTYIFPGFEVARHYGAIASKLQAVENGKIDRLMIFFPCIADYVLPDPAHGTPNARKRSKHRARARPRVAGNETPFPTLYPPDFTYICS